MDGFIALNAPPQVLKSDLDAIRTELSSLKNTVETGIIAEYPISASVHHSGGTYGKWYDANPSSITVCKGKYARITVNRYYSYNGDSSTENSFTIDLNIGATVSQYSWQFTYNANGIIYLQGEMCWINRINGTILIMAN